MINRALLLAAIAAVLTGCGSTKTTTVTVTTSNAPTTTAQVPVSPAPMAVTVYRVRAGLLFPEVVHVPRTQAVAASALGALGLGVNVTVHGGTASVDLPKATQDEQAEIVYTLTQFPSITQVDVAGRMGLTRADFARYEPPILVETPAPGADVPATFHVGGSASVFEATLVVQVVRDGEILDKQTVTASAGAPARGSFSTTLTGTPGDATVQAFAPSAADGSPQHEVDVPVTIAP